nr:hypothetical protein [Rhodoferax sp.]
MPSARDTGASPTRGGSIVLNGSINAHIGMPNSSVYALHLVSPESGFIVGTEIVADGGMSQM